MMRELLIPSRIGSYFLRTQKILSIDLSDNTIKAVLLNASGKQLTIEKWFEEPAFTSEEKSQAIIHIKEAIGTKIPDRIAVTLSSEQMSFKRLTLPFSNISKIRQVLPFELGDTLPFPLDDAVFDALTTKVSENEAQTAWLTTALQTDNMNRRLLPLLEQNYIPTRVTTGPIEEFSTLLYLQALLHEKTYVLISSNTRSTEISLVQNQELLAVRTIGYGIDETISEIDAQTLEEGSQKTIQRLIHEIQFSIQALMRGQKITISNYTIILLENASQMSSFDHLINQTLGQEVQAIKPLDIIKLPTVELAGAHQLPVKFFKSLAAALPWTISQNFNLGRMFQEEHQKKLFIYQSVIALVVTILLLGTPIVLNIFWVGRLRLEAAKSKQEITTRLKKEFNLTGRQRSLKDSLNQAEQALIKNEQLWSALTTNKYAFLRYIQKINTSLSREKLNLDIRRFVIRRDEVSGQEIIFLEGSVPNFAALREFEEGLQATKLFALVPRLQDVRFSLQLPIQKDALGDL